MNGSWLKVDTKVAPSLGQLHGALMTAGRGRDELLTIYSRATWPSTVDCTALAADAGN
jgi:hypothetical protein